MKIDYIIPTIGRPEIERTKQSIFDERINHNILICDTENSAGENRNKCLEKNFSLHISSKKFTRNL